MTRNQSFKVQPQGFCSALPVPTTSITTPTYLTIPLATPAGAIEVFGTTGNRISDGSSPNLPVLIIHQQFLSPGAAQRLNKSFNKSIRFSLAEEASAALKARTESSPLCSAWLRNIGRSTESLGTVSLFGAAERSYHLPTHTASQSRPIHGPQLLICLTAPPTGIVINSPSYTHMAIRLFQGDAILSPYLGDEISLVPDQEKARFARLFGSPNHYKSVFAAHKTPPIRMDQQSGEGGGHQQPWIRRGRRHAGKKAKTAVKKKLKRAGEKKKGSEGAVKRSNIKNDTATGDSRQRTATVRPSSYWSPTPKSELS